MSVNDTLKERGNKYGEFVDHSHISQNLQNGMKCTPGWNKLSYDKKEALQMIQHKIARILNGDPEYKDNWHDIQGYAKLAEDLCEDTCDIAAAGRDRIPAVPVGQDGLE